MSITGVCCDSFDHYDTAGIGYKWTVAGGSIDATHVRTGTQALKIQAGDAPQLWNLMFPIDSTGAFSSGFVPQYQQFAIGIAYYTETLNGTVFEVWNTINSQPTPVRLLYFGLNADGSVSLYLGDGTLLATSATALVLANTFFHFTLSVNLDAGAGDTYATVTITNCSTLSSTDLTATTFVPALVSMDSVYLAGPVAPSFAWCDDFYVASINVGDAAEKAPKVYLALPSADAAIPVYIGQQIVFPPGAGDGPWQPNFPHTALVNSVPPDTSQGIEWSTGYQYSNPPAYPLTWNVIQTLEAFVFDATAVPDGSTILFLQSSYLTEFPNQILLWQGGWFTVVWDDNSGAFTAPYQGTNIYPNFPQPWGYYLVASTGDPVNSFAPFDIADFKAARRSLGPTQNFLQ